MAISVVIDAVEESKLISLRKLKQFVSEGMVNSYRDYIVLPALRYFDN